MLNLQGETAVVTGAASGIGLALARRLAHLGAHTVLADIDGKAVEDLAREIDGVPVSMDVSVWKDNHALATAVGAPRVLCLNAGIVGPHAGPVWDTPADEWSRVMATNLGGVVHGLRAFVPGMLADGMGHSILITSSLAGLVTWAGGGAYAASKHAIVAVAEQAALSLSGTAVGVTMLCPALVRSGMSRAGLDPDVVAVEVIRGLDAGRFSVVPVEWSPSIRNRGERLSLGLQPLLPAPSQLAVTEL